MFVTVLTAPKTFPAVQAFIASAIADRDMAAVGTGRRVLLKMSDGLAQRLNSASRGSRFKRVAIAGGIGGFHFQQVSVFGNGQLRHWPVHVFFYFFEQTGDGQLWLIPIGGVGLAIAGDELKSHPPED